MRSRSLNRNITLYLMLVSVLAVVGSAGLWLWHGFSSFQARTDRMRRDYVARQRAKVKARALEAMEYIQFKKSLAEARLKEQIKNRTQEAVQTAAHIYNRHKDSKTKEEIGRLIHDALYSVSWDDGKGYYFAEDMQGNELINRNNPELEGTNLMNLQDSKGVYIMRRILEVAKNKGEGFCSYHWNKPGEPGVLLPKYSYVKYFKPLDWVIGTGKYLLEEEKEIQQEVLARLDGLKVGESGYIFIVTYDGTMLTYPARGADVTRMTDANGKNIYQSIMKTVRAGGGFVDYVMVKLGEEKVAPKVSYCVGVDDWQWYLGFGVYTDEIEQVIAQRTQEMRQQIYRQLLLLGLLVGLLLVLSLLLSRFISRGIEINLNSFRRFFSRASEELKPIPLQEVTFDEFEDMATTANHMIQDIQKAQVDNQQLQEQLLRAQKMEAIGLMAGGVAHDLNNILSGVVTVPELVLLKMDPDDPLRRHIETIMESGQRAAAVVEDLLTVGRGVVTKKNVIDLNRFVQRTMDRLRKGELQDRSPGIDFVVETIPDPLHVHVSLIHLDKVLLNLVTNAVEEISGDGRITVSTRLVQTRTHLSGYQDVPPGDYAVLTVADNGPGIAPEDQARIFEPFYTKKVIGKSGTGLGLSIVWNAMQDHRGYIQFESSTGGTKFHLYFPLAEGYGGTKEIPEEPAIPRGHGETVLIVDDEAIQRNTATGLLESLGYQPRMVVSGEEAIFFLQSNRVDIILLDMMLGRGINGLETYRRILADHPGQKALLVTGFAASKDVEEALALGASQCLHKPYRLATLARALADALH